MSERDGKGAPIRLITVEIHVGFNPSTTRKEKSSFCTKASNLFHRDREKREGERDEEKVLILREEKEEEDDERRKTWTQSCCEGIKSANFLHISVNAKGNLVDREEESCQSQALLLQLLLLYSYSYYYSRSSSSSRINRENVLLSICLYTYHLHSTDSIIRLSLLSRSSKRPSFLFDYYTDRHTHTHTE